METLVKWVEVQRTITFVDEIAYENLFSETDLIQIYLIDLYGSYIELY